MTKIKVARSVVPLLVILAVVSGIFGALRYGGICTLAIAQVAESSNLRFMFRSLPAVQIPVTCPLGFLERSLAARELLPQWFVSVGFVVFSVVLLGRVFCAWICPTGLVRRVFKDRGEAIPRSLAASHETLWASYSSYAVLGGVLLTSFWFRFPVFCFFCPVGLFFGALYAVMRLFSPDPLSAGLVLFPVLLGVELWVLKSWCRSLCPLGALLSILGNMNRFLVPTVKKDQCLASKGVNCSACRRVCPEGIDLTNQRRRFLPNSCTKCLKCLERCPVKAIKLPLWA